MKSINSQIRNLPHSPGVYLFKDSKKKILYVGKANNLSQRVKSYFKDQSRINSPKIIALQKEIYSLEYQLCESEVDALITEAKLIKKYNPKYNIILRDDKNYFFVGITHEKFPRLFITHQPDQPQNTVTFDSIGPFTDGFALKETIKHLRSIYPYRHCRTLPKKACLQYHLKRCLAPCIFPDSQTVVKKNIKSIYDILQGNKTSLLKKLEKQMLTASKKEQYSKAGQLKIQIDGIKNIFSHSKFLQRFKEIKRDPYDWKHIESVLQTYLQTKKSISRVECYDISNISGKYAVGSMVVFNNGLITKNQYRKFKIKYSPDEPNDPKMIAEVLLRRMKHSDWPLPDLIIVDGGITQLMAAQKVVFRNQLITSLAKKNEELRTIVDPNPTQALRLGQDVLHFVQNIRDESHRFAITYHRTLRSKLN